ncbi:uncharacterized protein EAE98_012292 [Botrytis deweyae]|uniref:BTB domain-containing protein n=1 Tax=Botrytis deweyae TaxID=2478750 RepID=A0ABQ7I3J3_9HELO|nr:uncharacterized protein EAE98_012292 [Botrytis deweyae]KAF7909213.1 hypothetical protein EAE98_012292 [Botrytis deweyae]
MVSIQVGEGSKATVFNVLKGVLCRKVSFFNTMFNHGWLEASTKPCTLPDDDPEAFSILMHWVFDVPHEAPITFTVKGLQTRSKTLMNLATLADKYLIDDLPDLIETRLIQKDLTRLNDSCYELPKASWYRLAWELIPRSSILRECVGSQNTPKHKFAHLNGMLVEPETLRVTRQILREWKETSSRRLDIGADMQGFRTFRELRDVVLSGRVNFLYTYYSSRFWHTNHFDDFVFCSTIMLDEKFLQYCWRSKHSMSQSDYLLSIANLPMHVHR